MRIVEHAIKQKWKEKSQRERESAAHRHTDRAYQKLQVGKSNADYQTNTEKKERRNLKLISKSEIKM